MTLEMFLAHPSVQALGRALLHLIWQGSLLALLLRFVKTITSPSAARLRYAAASLIMLAMPIALIVTVTWNSRTAQQSDAPAAEFSPQVPAAAPAQRVYDAPVSSTPHAGILGWVVCIWMVGVLLLCAGVAGSWMGIQKLTREARPAMPGLEDVLRRLQHRLRVSVPVRLCVSTTVQVPTAIGWLRPYILLPVAALTGLSETQIVAILAHELAHIRRRDYLLNSLQTAIETVLFYHPAVWWVGRQMRLEREHCCDDIAVSVCGSAFEYANALAEMEQIRGRIPEPALAATGGDLMGRIRRILGRQEPTSRSLGSVTAPVLVLSVAGATAIVSLYAVPQDAPPAFEIASIKRDVSGKHIRFTKPFPTLHIEGSTLKDLILLAYHVHDFEITGGPAWIDSDLYDIDAKAERPPTRSPQFANLQWRRLQTLLHDRFSLAIHRETRELPVYELTVAKVGLKVQPATCIQRITGDTNIASDKKPSDYCGPTEARRGRIEASGAAMAFLADLLSSQLSRPVVDKTGIHGDFQIHLTYAPDALAASPGAPGFRPTDADATADPGPDIFAAMQEQLGLKLQPAKGPVEVLVIDHVEKPTEN
jgi:uncharacterized protein (TIGR03435 family)